MSVKNRKYCLKVETSADVTGDFTLTLMDLDTPGSKSNGKTSSGVVQEQLDWLPVKRTFEYPILVIFRGIKMFSSLPISLTLMSLGSIRMDSPFKTKIPFWSDPKPIKTVK